MYSCKYTAIYVSVISAVILCAFAARGENLVSYGLYGNFKIEPRMGRSPLTTSFVFNRLRVDCGISCDSIDSIRFTVGENGYQYSDSILNTEKIEYEHTYTADGSYVAGIDFRCISTRWSSKAAWYMDSRTDIIVSDSLYEYEMAGIGLGAGDTAWVRLVADNDGFELIEGYAGDTAALYLDPEASTTPWNFKYNTMLTVLHDSIADSAITWDAYKMNSGPVLTDGRYKSEQYLVMVIAGTALSRTVSSENMPLDALDRITLSINYRDTVLEKTWYIIQRHYNSVESPGAERPLLDGSGYMMFDPASNELKINKAVQSNAEINLSVYGTSGNRCVAMERMGSNAVKLPQAAGCYVAVLEYGGHRYALKFVNIK